MLRPWTPTWLFGIVFSLVLSSSCQIKTSFFLFFLGVQWSRTARGSSNTIIPPIIDPPTPRLIMDFILSVIKYLNAKFFRKKKKQMKVCGWIYMDFFYTKHYFSACNLLGTFPYIHEKTNFKNLTEPMLCVKLGNKTTPGIDKEEKKKKKRKDFLTGEKSPCLCFKMLIGHIHFFLLHISL